MKQVCTTYPSSFSRFDTLNSHHISRPIKEFSHKNIYLSIRAAQTSIIPQCKPSNPQVQKPEYCTRHNLKKIPNGLVACAINSSTGILLNRSCGENYFPCQFHEKVNDYLSFFYLFILLRNFYTNTLEKGEKENFTGVNNLYFFNVYFSFS